MKQGCWNCGYRIDFNCCSSGENQQLGNKGGSLRNELIINIKGKPVTDCTGYKMVIGSCCPKWIKKAFTFR
jgi:hypothetical protein